MVEDAIQDLFVYLWDNRQNTTEVDNIKFYLFKALRNNLTRMIMKNSASSGPVIRQGEYATKESCILSHMEELAHIEDTETIEMRVRELVNLLSGRQREVLYLRFFQDMNYEQISSLLEIDLKYTYNIYSKAILQLKRYLAEGFNLFVD